MSTIKLKTEDGKEVIVPLQNKFVQTSVEKLSRDIEAMKKQIAEIEKRLLDKQTSKK